jgi:hypothetical protein
MCAKEFMTLKECYLVGRKEAHPYLSTANEPTEGSWQEGISALYSIT